MVLELVKNKMKYLKRVKKIVFSCLKDESVRVYLFGSWAYGKPAQSSDIDIGLVPAKKITLNKLVLQLRDAFEESTIPYPVEIVDLSKTNKHFKDKVMQKGILWKN